MVRRAQTQVSRERLGPLACPPPAQQETQRANVERDGNESVGCLQTPEAPIILSRFGSSPVGRLPLPKATGEASAQPIPEGRGSGVQKEETHFVEFKPETTGQSVPARSKAPLQDYSSGAGSFQQWAPGTLPC